MGDMFGIHGRALLVHSERAGLAAENIANANTPGYKAKGMDFKKVLAGNSMEIGLSATSSGHIPLQKTGRHHYLNPLAPALDGNTVDVEAEKVNLAEIQGQYETALSFITGAVKSKMQVIRGD